MSQKQVRSVVTIRAALTKPPRLKRIVEPSKLNTECVVL